MRYHIFCFLLLLAASVCRAQEAQDSVLIINEVQVSNIDQYLDNANCYGAWIELYNPTSTAQPLRGLTLTDGVNSKKMVNTFGSVQAGGYKVLWFDHDSGSGNYGTGARTQIPFKLNPEGGTITLLSADNQVITSVTYPEAIPRCSWARTKDGGETWAYTGEPTPEATNTTSRFSANRLPAPTVDTDSRLFDESFTISVKKPNGLTLRYTTDGSAPTATNGETSTNGRFTISETTILRFCYIRNGYLPSPVVTRSYIYRNHDYYLPVLSVCSEPKNFFDNKVGVFVKGTNGISGNGQSTACNWNMDWERPVNFEYLVPQQDEDGNIQYDMVLNQEADLEICGGWTRAYGGGEVDGRNWDAKSSFRLKTDKRYEGVNVIDYPVFPLKTHNKYRCWQVRNGGNDTYARIKDPAIQQIVLRSGFYVDCQDYQPAHVFLNGYYYGMLNIRESNNKHFGYSNYGIDFDDMDQFDLSNAQYNQKLGDEQAWKQLLSLASTLSRTKSEETYREICDLLDMDEYVNYMALECYMGASDWLTNTNNVKGFRSRSDGKFHFVLFDTESAFAYSDMLTAVLNTSGGANVDDLFRYLMKYDPFRRQFMDAYCIVDGSVFDPTRCDPIIWEIFDNINPALRFEGYNSSLGLMSSIRSAHNGTRITNMRNYYQTNFGLYATISANIPSARLSVNGQEFPTGRFAGYLFSYKGRPIQLAAKAPAGYHFVGWRTENSTATTTELIPLGSEWMYYDQGSMDGRDWKSPSFDESQNGWRQGTAPFGYANEGYYMQENSATKLDYGSNKSNKRPTYYFRKSFTLDAPIFDDDVFIFNFQVDDGMILYVNGYEVGSYYVTSGSPYSSFTLDGHYEEQNPYQGSIIIPNEYLVTGLNQIAVEAKNCSASSSDMWFDGSLSLTGKGGAMITENAVDTLDLREQFEKNSNVVLSAVFEPVQDEQQRWQEGASPLRINEVSAGNDIYISEYVKRSDWLELYNTTDQDISLSGLYLSDKRSKPQKFQLQDGVVPAHGTRIIWCDEQEPISQLHAPFKLENADGACVSIQAADGSWADCLHYMEQGKWQTYGRYPDGGNMATILNQPTIDKSNKLGMMDYNALTEEDWLGEDRTITLALAEGWNWTSHNLSESVDKSRFITNAQSIRGQDDDLVLNDEAVWEGTLQSLKAAKGYKIKMRQASDVTLRGPIYNVEKPVVLHRGWNWIGCPLYNATTLEAAFANYVPEEGDKLVGLDVFATYENGQWNGTLTTLQPGQSYLLYTAQDQDFCWQSLSPVKSHSKRYAPARQAQDDTSQPWPLDIHAYPDVMTVVAEVQTEGQISLEGRYYVGAFCGDECRGWGVMDEDVLFMNIHGEDADRLVFRLIDADGEVYETPSYVLFQSLKQLGTMQEPFPIWFGSQDILDEIKPALASSSAVRAIQYFNLSGQLIARPEGGICVRKVIYEDGSVQVTKILADN